MPFFSLPLALIGLVSVPLLVAIYWLRRRHQNRLVSSLLLWEVPGHSPAGGIRLEPVRISWLFMLEVGVLVLLALAAAGPWLPLGSAQRPLIVVLDDSFSMRAGARDRATDRLGELMRDRDFGTTRFLIAGPLPRWLNIEATSARGAVLADVLESWEALSAEANIDEAIAMAREVGGPHTRVLIVTDEPPRSSEASEDSSETVSGVRWEAFGEARANVGFINAARSSSPQADGSGRVMLEVANFADERSERTLSLGDGRSRRLTLDPGEMRRLWFDVPAGEVTEAELSGDALAIDDRVVLMEPYSPRVRAVVDVRRPEVAQPLERALAAIPGAMVVQDSPHLLFTDAQELEGVDSSAWLVHVMVEQRTHAYLGPFVIDRTHPLTQGLNLDRVIWSAGEREDVGAAVQGGRLLIAVGNVPLITEHDRPDRTRMLQWRWRPDRSTLHHSADFPALIWNMVAWRQSHLPGLAETNLRLGMMATLHVHDGVEAVRVTEPAGVVRAVRVADASIHVEARRPGVYELETDSLTHRFAVNALAADQSDLRGKATGVWDGWDYSDADEEGIRHRSIQWLLLLLALGMLAIHGWIVMRSE